MSLEALIFDLDGVVTATAKVHFAAWKALFDVYLQEHSAQHNAPFKEFTEDDYLRHVDGMPRYDGVRTFLSSRGIKLPDGDVDDGPEKVTVCGLGNRKNATFNQALEDQGVRLFDSTISLIKTALSKGIRTAIVSSSKNCERILKRAGVEDLFEVRVDGVVLHDLGRPGKPAPDMFVEAAERLGVEVGNSVVFEDAISGVQAGRAGHFGLVIGIDRKGGAMTKDLAEQGADVVVSDLEELTLGDIESWFLPSALDSMDDLHGRLIGKKVVIFFDYDGTLTPIVSHPDLAVLSEEMRDALRRLGERFTTAIVSGRGLADVLKKVGLPELYYAGNHGFEIQGPNGSPIKNEMGAEFLDDVNETYDEILKEIGGIKGIVMEHKTYTLSVHYRLVEDENEVGKIETSVDAAIERHPNLKKHLGKKVFEIRPRIDWDKGKAVLWLLKVLALDDPNVVPIYVGDDVTDEDAFEALKGRGIGILVSDKLWSSAATYRLKNTNEVQRFLSNLITVEV